MKCSGLPGFRAAGSEAAWGGDALDQILEAAKSGVCINLDGEETTLSAKLKLQDAMIDRVREKETKLLSYSD
jgi:hypothetical protein